MKRLRPKRKVVISVHGVETQGVWQKDLAPLISEQGWIYYPLHYGIFRLYEFILPWKRQQQIEWLRTRYREVRNRHPEVIPSIIAHSFGTLIVSEALDIYDGIQADKIIICGSIVRRDYNWAKIFKRKQATKVRNDYAQQDYVPAIASFFARGVGPSGQIGFLTSHNRLEDKRFERYSHSSAFDYDHYEKHWIPFLDKPMTYEGESRTASYYEDDISPYDAAKWSAKTYFHQYIRRAVDAISTDEVIAAETSGKLTPKELWVILPLTPGSASPAARYNFVKRYGLKEARFGRIPDSRSAHFSSGTVLYDIPTTLNSLGFLDHRSDDELTGAVTEFGNYLQHLVTRSDSDCGDVVKIVKLDNLPESLT